MDSISISYDKFKEIVLEFNQVRQDLYNNVLQMVKYTLVIIIGIKLPIAPNKKPSNTILHC